MKIIEIDKVNKEYLLEKGKDGKTLIVEDDERAVILFLNLLFMKRGSIPDEPLMGIDFNDSYKFMISNKENVNKLLSDINSQIKTYIPDISYGVSLSNSATEISLSLTVTKTNNKYSLMFSSVGNNLKLQNININQ